MNATASVATEVDQSTRLRIVSEGQSATATRTGVYLGMTLYEKGGSYFVVYRARTYDGVKVKDSYDTGRVSLEATADETAKAEATQGYVSFAKVYGVTVMT